MAVQPPWRQALADFSKISFRCLMQQHPSVTGDNYALEGLCVVSVAAHLLVGQLLLFTGAVGGCW